MYYPRLADGLVGFTTQDIVDACTNSGGGIFFTSGILKRLAGSPPRSRESTSIDFGENTPQQSGPVSSLSKIPP